MRLNFASQRLDCPLIEQVHLNLNCRDEIIPILRALQHLYADKSALSQILDLVGGDVNPGSSHNVGRQGLDYWSITVLAAMLHRQWQADHPERLCRRVNRVLRRNEQARFYSWEARKRLPPKRLQQRE